MRHPGRTQKIMNQKYVEARISGKSKKESKDIAGYSKTFSASRIERPGGPVANLMTEALDKLGITEEFLAREYARGMKESTTPQGRVGDYNAHAKYLLQLGYLRGYGKQGPLVAIQNNYGTSEELDAPAARELLEKISGLLPDIEAEISLRKSARVHAGDLGVINTEAHPGMDQPAG